MGVKQIMSSLSCLAAFVLCLSYGVGASYYLCPRVDETIIEESPCPAECYGDSQCSGDDSELNNTLCCPTSNCGRQCMRGVSIPYHPQPPVCPELDSDIVGACTEFCSSDSDCSETNQICCSNGCGHGCVTVSPTCRRILESRNGTFLIGEYRPQCDDDGMFTQIQCHGSTGNCWCVRPETGEPVSTSISRQPECNTCSHKGQTYYPGDTFPDDCNTCTCSEDGTAGCTEMGCGPAALFFSCPVLEEDVAGICSDYCTGDESCTGGQKCCSNGCGHTCQNPTPIPFVPPTRYCPEDPTSVECNDSECTESCDGHRQLCCQNSCGGRVCIDGELPVSPCTDAVNSLSSNSLLGSYVPQCQEETGTFKTLQCHSHYCWCVDSLSGEPSSDMVETSHIDSLECAKCTVNGHVYKHQEAVASHNGCAFKICRAGEVVVNEECKVCEHEGGIYGDGQVVKYYQECSKLKCVSGELVRNDTCESCVGADGHTTYKHGENTRDCYCICLDGVEACAESSEPCDSTSSGGEVEVDMEWWHYLIVGAGLLIAVLVIIALILIVVMVIVIRSGQFRHTKLRESSDTLSFESETQVMFKSAPPEAESVELKVPVEDDEFEDPVKT